MEYGFLLLIIGESSYFLPSIEKCESYTNFIRLHRRSLNRILLLSSLNLITSKIDLHLMDFGLWLSFKWMLILKCQLHFVEFESHRNLSVAKGKNSSLYTEYERYRMILFSSFTIVFIANYLWWLSLIVLSSSYTGIMEFS